MLPSIAATALLRCARRGTAAARSASLALLERRTITTLTTTMASAPSSMAPRLLVPPPASSRASLPLFTASRCSSWSFGSSPLSKRGVCSQALRRDDDENEDKKSLSSPSISSSSRRPRQQRRAQTLPFRAFSALPGSPPSSSGAGRGSGLPSEIGSLGYRREGEGSGVPPAPPPPPPLSKNGAATSSSSAHTSTASAAAPTTPTSSSGRERAALARELHTVSVAIAANAAIFAAKACAYVATGSSAMLAECVHSVVDTANQALLRLGVTRSRRPPTALHPYGFMKDKFVWSLVSAVGIFCMGAGATVAHGASALIDALGVSSGAATAAGAASVPEVTNLGVSAAVLTVSAVVESYSLLVATRAVAAGAAAAGLSFSEYVRRGSDPTSVAVMLEDGAAVAGLAIAGLATAATAATGNVAWDAAGSLAVGALLGATAVFLIQQNRSLLIGRAMNSVDMQRVLNHLARDPAVAAVFDAKSEEIGPGVYRFKAEIEFDGDVVVKRARERSAAANGRGAAAARVRAAVLDSSRPDEALDLALDAYGRELVGALGAEVDRIEASIRKFMPSIRHIDLEADRGSGGSADGVRHSLRDPVDF